MHYEIVDIAPHACVIPHDDFDIGMLSWCEYLDGHYDQVYVIQTGERGFMFSFESYEDLVMFLDGCIANLP